MLNANDIWRANAAVFLSFSRFNMFARCKVIHIIKLRETKMTDKVDDNGGNPPLCTFMGKYTERNRDLHMVFIDLEKAYDCFLRDKRPKEMDNLQKW
ncbi:hypothetical protein L6452_00060 [Arctium lappa]|uniref:Uncharacterized protein n=1 Tax=Arctium lappa TaxID=4217 RepID=A0ACB9FCY0_ARCLA|nr:hypothetical protein L6452_00060 [Arctium lappa]